MSNNETRARTIIYLPLILSIVLIAGIYLGKFIHFDKAGFGAGEFSNNNKVENILDYIENEYVDTISREKLTEETIISMLQQLDPHSQYIPASELQEVNESLEGNFSGIGVEFNIINDTIVVVSAIAGGPSETLGITAGDRIVKVDGKAVTGIKIKNSDVVKRLRGVEGTIVNVDIKRGDQKQLLHFKIKRGEIPITSVDAAFMLNSEVGYIKISRFASKTFEEYLEAFGKLANKGMNKLILDLRGNPGGYLNAAIKLADEFIPKGKLIVYTEGKARPKESFIATTTGGWENKHVCILIDEGSASASEIVAGALQDNDIGTLIGRRSFGKGLVQEQKDLPDGSAIRLTIARYYTPTGRSIQRPYSNNLDAYYEEVYDRYQNGELTNQDSSSKHVKKDSLIYKTAKGKILYGGGGITPDIFVPLDTVGYTSYFSELVNSGTLNKYAFKYCDVHRRMLKEKFKTIDSFKKNFELGESEMTEFLQFSIQQGIKENKGKWAKSYQQIKLQLTAQIARNFWGSEGFYSILESKDKSILKAIEVMNKH
ncbi:MAG: S41 family peptidase [Bacteroidia bacterium]|nr:S41 family peptidase [Bacteroidia bacterium]